MRSFFRKLAENWKLKTMAFALAVLLWVVVSAEQVASNWFWVPLEIQVNDPNYQLTQPEVREVQVRFTGPGRDLLDVAVRRPPLRLTIGDVDSDTVVYALDPRMVQVPGQVAVNAQDVRPSTVRLEFTRVETRTLPVRVRVGDALGPEWAVVDSLVATPKQIRVSGPLARVSTLTEVATEPLEITPGDSVVNRAVAIDTSGLRGVTLSARTVNVTGRVDRVVERVFMQTPVDVGPGVSLQPGQVTVRLRGPERTLQGLNRESFRVAVSIVGIPTRIPEEGVAVPLRVDRLPPGVQATIEPSEVRLIADPTPAQSLPMIEDGDTGDPEIRLGVRTPG